MAAINANDLGKFVGQLEVAPIATPTTFTRIGSVRGLNALFDTAANQVEVKADDTGTVFKGYKPEARIEGSFLEVASRDLMKIILGGTNTDVAGSLVSGATQVLSSGSWAVNTYYAIENQNGDGSAITINSVTGATDGALTANDDYDIVQLASGEYGIVLQDVASATNLTTVSQNITIDYDYTPNASEQLALTVAFTEAQSLVVRITATSGSNTRRVTISSGTFEGAYGLEFLDIVEAGDLNGTSFVFKANDAATFTYYNEIL